MSSVPRKLSSLPAPVRAPRFASRVVGQPQKGSNIAKNRVVGGGDWGVGGSLDFLWLKTSPLPMLQRFRQAR